MEVVIIGRLAVRWQHDRENERGCCQRKQCDELCLVTHVYLGYRLGLRKRLVAARHSPEGRHPVEPPSFPYSQGKGYRLPVNHGQSG